MVELKRLGHLLALADECHFARAAERVHLSQPAFSRSIQAIEREVGMRLFDRQAGDVKPTPAGVFMIERARRLLFDARSLHRDAALYRDSRLGDTAFGAGPFPAATIMPRVMIELRRLHPEVRLRLDINNWQGLLAQLLAEELEFFVSDVRDLPADSKIQVQSLGRQPAHLFVRQGHPLAGRACSFAEAWQFGVAATRFPSPMMAAVAQLIGLPPGELPMLALECNDLTLLRQLALATDTVVATADASLSEDLEAGLFVQLRIMDLYPAYSQMGLVTLVNRTPSPMAQRAMACIQDVAKSVNLPAKT